MSPPGTTDWFAVNHKLQGFIHAVDIRTKKQRDAVVACRYTGEKLHDARIDGLLEASWQPAPEGSFPDLPQSPRANSSSDQKASTSGAPPQKQGDMSAHLAEASGTGIFDVQKAYMCCTQWQTVCSHIQVHLVDPTSFTMVLVSQLHVRQVCAKQMCL